MKSWMSGRITIVAVLLPLTVAAILSGCAPSQSAIQTAIAQTQIAAISPTPPPTVTAVPTDTPRPSQTSTEIPTDTPTFTLTPIPTNTQTSTRTATATSSSTPTPLPPPTQTALAVAASRTALAANSTATRMALIAQRTGTAEAKSERATQVAQYKAIVPQELVSYSEQHLGEKIKVRGRVFNIVGNIELQMYIAGTYDAVYVIMSSRFSGIYENNAITVYGVVGSENCFKNVYDAEICQPLIKDAFYEK